MAIWLIILCAVGVVAQEECPGRCKCKGTTVHCSNINAVRVPDDIPTWTEELYLQRNRITEVSASSFNGLDNVKKIDLAHNDLRSIDARFLANVTNLKVLVLSNNKLTSLSFPVSHNLWSLFIAHNQIRDIYDSDFHRLKNLKELDLSHNRLSAVRYGIFKNRSQLELLNYHGNRINIIEPGSFDNLTKLTQLKLSKNKLVVIPKNLFQNLSYLHTLDLSRNSLSVISGLTFKGLGRLKVLRLRRNDIEILQDGAFFGLKNISELLLDDNRISNVTNGWLYGLESLKMLSLSRNQLTNIDKDSWKFCENLVELDLSVNRLNRIVLHTFAHLSHLATLNVSFNSISYIQAESFKELTELEVLFLGHNRISYALEATPNVFQGLENLITLDLGANYIRTVPAHLFIGLHGLQNLYLIDNDITTIEENCFSPLSNLRRLELSSGHLVCDCHLSWLPHTIRVFTSVNGSCMFPEHLRGRTVSHLTPQDFKCYDQFRLRITEDPVTGIALKGETVNLTCRAAMVSEEEQPFIKFYWMKDQILLNNVVNVTYGQVVSEPDEDFENSTRIELTSHLILSNISDEAAGMYQCVASHRYGNTYSKPANITVYVFPVFNDAPRQVSVKTGNSARLDCSATGQPSPKISFFRADVDPKSGSFPAAVERRVQVGDTERDRDVFYITDVKVTDSGVYSCVARNTAGFITVNTTLTVLEPPSFRRAMAAKTAREGDAAVLECIVSGTPMPELIWQKDGEPLNPTDRHFFTAGKQILVIVQANQSDAGVYECLVSNYLGVNRGSVVLTILRHQYSFMHMTPLEITLVVIVIVIVIFFVLCIFVIRRKYLPERPDHAEYCDHALGSSELKINLRSSQLYCDTDSEHSSKDSGTGTEPGKRSVEELRHEGTRTDSTYLSDSHQCLNTPSMTPKLTTFHPRPTNHERCSSGECWDVYVP